MLILVVFILIASALCFYVQKSLNYWRRRNVYQVNWTLHVKDILHTLFRRTSFVDILVELHSRCKNHRFIGGYQFFSPVIWISDPNLIKTILVKDFDHFTNHRDFAAPEADPFWNRALFALKGEKWHAMRTTLSPSFSSVKMRSMFTLVDEAAKKYVEFYKSGPKQFNIEFKESYARLTNDIIAICAFGIQINSLENPKNDFYVTTKTASNFGGRFSAILLLLNTSSKFFAKLCKIPVFTKNAQVFFEALIKTTLKIREEQHIIRPDMIHLLMQAKKDALVYEEDKAVSNKTIFSMLKPSQIDLNKKIKLADLTDRDIVAQALLFILGGFDTVTTALHMLSYEVGIRPDVQNRLRKEIQEAVDANNGELTFDAIQNMRYMDMVVSESMRKWTPSVFMDRVCTKTYKIARNPENYNEPELTINPGDVLMINTCGMHRDSKVFPDPDKFDPERFSDERRHNITPYSYIPFGVGPRHCIAVRFALLEMKTIIAHLLFNFELYPVEKTHIPMKLDNTLNISPKGGNWMGMKRLD